MVTIEPDDARSMEQASEVIDLAQISAVVDSVVYQSWLRLKDFDLVGARFRAFTDRALEDFGNDNGQFVAGLGVLATDDDEAQIRQGLYLYWVGLPKNRRNHDVLNREFRQIVDKALAGLVKN